MLRLGAIAAGVLSVAAAVAGCAGLIAKPDAVVWASAPLDRPVVVIPPQVLAMDGVLDVVVEGEPYVEIRTAQSVDVYAWLQGESSTVVRGLSSWTEVSTVSPQIYTYDGDERTGDIWRSKTAKSGPAHIRPADIPPGLAVVVMTPGHTPLDKVSIQLSREPGNEWAWPAISAGALLAAVSIILFAVAWLAPARAPAPDPAKREGAEVIAPTRTRRHKRPKEATEPKVTEPKVTEPQVTEPKVTELAPEAATSRRARRASKSEGEK